MKIAVAGLGYVGLSLACLLAKNNDVVAVDVVEEKVRLVNEGKSPIRDKDIELFLQSKPANLVATLDARAAYKQAEYVVVAVPTNYDPEDNCFDTSYVEEAIELVLEANQDAVIVIKSTVPVGYTAALSERYPQGKSVFSPSFYARGARSMTTYIPPELLRERQNSLFPNTRKS